MNVLSICFGKWLCGLVYGFKFTVSSLPSLPLSDPLSFLSSLDNLKSPNPPKEEEEEEKEKENKQNSGTQDGTLLVFYSSLLLVSSPNSFLLSLPMPSTSLPTLKMKK